METTRYLLRFFLMTAAAFFLIALVWWLVSTFTPIKASTLFGGGRPTASTTVNSDWLPPPRQYGGLLSSSTTMPKEYVAGSPYVSSAPFNGYGVSDNDKYIYSKVSYINYTTPDGGVSSHNTQNKEVIKKSNPATQTTTPTQKILYVRNLSLYEGGPVYTGFSFVGEAKSTMFRDGKFPIVVVDSRGSVVGISVAIARDNWTVPGWVKFETKVMYALPSNMPCTMIFEGALTTEEQKTMKPVRIPFAVKCN